MWLRPCSGTAEECKERRSKVKRKSSIDGEIGKWIKKAGRQKPARCVKIQIQFYKSDKSSSIWSMVASVSSSACVFFPPFKKPTLYIPCPAQSLTAGNAVLDAQCPVGGNVGEPLGGQDNSPDLA